MLVAFALVIALLVAVVAVYPFFAGLNSDEHLDSEPDPAIETSIRWESAVVGLRNAELEWSLGNLLEADYLWLRDQYVSEAATLMVSMDLNEVREQEKIDELSAQVNDARIRVFGTAGVPPVEICASCDFGILESASDCPQCGEPLVRGTSISFGGPGRISGGAPD